MNNRRQHTVRAFHNRNETAPAMGRQTHFPTQGMSLLRRPNISLRGGFQDPRSCDSLGLSGGGSLFSRFSKNVSNISLMSPRKCAEAALEKILVPSAFLSLIKVVPETLNSPSPLVSI